MLFSVGTSCGDALNRKIARFFAKNSGHSPTSRARVLEISTSKHSIRSNVKRKRHFSPEVSRRCYSFSGSSSCSLSLISSISGVAYSNLLVITSHAPPIHSSLSLLGLLDPTSSRSLFPRITPHRSSPTPQWTSRERRVSNPNCYLRF